MVFSDMLHGIVGWIGLPVLGIAAAAAYFTNKRSALPAILVAAVFMLALTFGDINTWKGIGQTVTNGIDSLKNLHA